MSTEPTARRLGDWLRRIARGDRRALEALYLETSPALLSLSIRFMRERDAAEDVLQEVYLTVWRKAGQFDACKGDPMAWLHVMLRNKALDALRRDPAIRSAPLSEIEALPDGALSAASLIELKATSANLQRHVERLEPRHARALRSIYFEGLTYAELASREQVPVPTAKSWVQRSLVQIRRSLDRSDHGVNAAAARSASVTRCRAQVASA